MATNVINDPASTTAAPVIRVVTRDIKSHMSISSRRRLPLGYSAADVPSCLKPTFDYLSAGSESEAVDFFSVSGRSPLTSISRSIINRIHSRLSDL